MKQVDLKDGSRFLIKCSVATSFFSRLLGLMGRSSIPAEQALLFPKCNSIHTYFMRFPIDVVFLDKQGVVLEVMEALGAWRFLLPRAKAKHVIELRAHRSKELGIEVGRKLQCEGVFR